MYFCILLLLIFPFSKLEHILKAIVFETMSMYKYLTTTTTPTKTTTTMIKTEIARKI